MTRKKRKAKKVDRYVVEATRILSIDPGNKSGIAIVTVSPNPKLEFWDIYKFGLKNQITPSQYVATLHAQLNFEAAVIEDQYLSISVDTTKKLARNTGRWLEACASVGVEPIFVAANAWQSATLGKMSGLRGQRKEAAGDIASQITGEQIPEDAADAFCMGRFVAIESAGVAKGANMWLR